MLNVKRKADEQPELPLTSPDVAFLNRITEVINKALRENVGPLEEKVSQLEKEVERLSDFRREVYEYLRREITRIESEIISYIIKSTLETSTDRILDASTKKVDEALSLIHI